MALISVLFFIAQEVIDAYMATRMASKLGAGNDDDDFGLNPSTKQEFDEFKKWLETTTAKAGSSSSATLPPKPVVVVDPMPPPAELPKKCKCNANPCNSIGL